MDTHRKQQEAGTREGVVHVCVHGSIQRLHPALTQSRIPHSPTANDETYFRYEYTPSGNVRAIPSFETRKNDPNGIKNSTEICLGIIFVLVLLNAAIKAKGCIHGDERTRKKWRKLRNWMPTVLRPFTFLLCVYLYLNQYVREESKWEETNGL
jgi:hypothetical protein